MASAKKIKETLNKAYLKVKLNRSQIDTLNRELNTLLQNAKADESEEHHKGLVAAFLKNTFYSDRFHINTKGRIDLVIHSNEKSTSPVSVIIEVKKPANKAEMITTNNLNKKAMQELVLYYLREKVNHHNLEVKNLIITNFDEWFIFDAQEFEKHFTDKQLTEQFKEFERGVLTDTKTEYFYSEIAGPAIKTAVEKGIVFTHFKIDDYRKYLNKPGTESDNKLIELYKILSPEHLLKLPFQNDSNSLNKEFYNELLHIIGLEEVKDGGKVTINRKEKNRNSGSILEEAIYSIDTLGKLQNLTDRSQYGSNLNEQTFNVALELSITWVNRILFLKLLEAQLIAYNKNRDDYSFLNIKKITNFFDLETLFFQVLAKEINDRTNSVKDKFKHVPYLNSSLFDLSDLERDITTISGLNPNAELPVYSQTVLKDVSGKKRTGELGTLEYFFEFLEAYDFSSELNDEVQEESKTLINASVLGLIFEKINGYRDGSFFTPGFITMYMCKEAIRMAVVNKFNEYYKWDCKTFKDLENRTDKLKTKQIKEANELMNSIRICDPAVGSGHFLVSALNEMIAVKFALGILIDEEGKGFHKYHLEVENDELIVLDQDAELFKYNPKIPESLRVQKTLFHEKQTLIENCLFGVDLNPNSVKICMLRLWIELLKNAYYKTDTELETLPNIDINIKKGNSLISRFDINADLRQALKQSKWTIDSYKDAVMSYKNATTKEQKRELLSFIDKVKTEFRTEIAKNDPLLLGLKQKEGELYNIIAQTELFGESEKEKIDKAKRIEKLQIDIENRKRTIESIKDNAIYKNAFEWRFEFPEVLNQDGDFMGFDIIIGNPPYIQLQRERGSLADELKDLGYTTYDRNGDIYCLFYEKGMHLLKDKGILNFITSNKWMRADYGKETRAFFCKHNPLELIDLGSGVFDSATVDTNILMLEKAATKPENYLIKALDLSKEKRVVNLEKYEDKWLSLNDISESTWTIAGPIEKAIKDKIEQKGTPLKDWDIEINYGIKTGYNDAFIIKKEIKDRLIAEDPKSVEILKPILRGRDIKRYKAQFADLWLINSHNGVKVKEGKKTVIKKKRIDIINDYPKVYEHLKQFETQLVKRDDQGDHWTNLRSCAYIEEFEKEKIIFQEMVQESNFTLDLNNNFFCLDTGRILTGSNLIHITGLLNSKLFFYSVKSYYGGGKLGNTGIRMKHTFFMEFPAINSLISNSKISTLVTQIIADKSSGKDTTALEQEIDNIVFKLYGLTYEEVKYIDPAFPLSEAEYNALIVE